MKVLVIGATGRTRSVIVEGLRTNAVTLSPRSSNMRTACMPMRNIRRLANLSAWGSGGASVPPANLFARYFFLPIVLRHVLADKRRGEAYLFASTLDYVNVCPAFLKDGPALGGVKASLDGRGLKQFMPP